MLFWSGAKCGKKFLQPLLKMFGDQSAFRIALWKLPSSLRAVPKTTFFTACWYDFNSKQLPFEKFLQNPFLGCLWSPWTGKIIWSAVESFYLMIWVKFWWRNHQSYRKLLRENQFLKILCSGFYCRSNYFACPGTP